IEYTEHLPLAQ
ncbi:unnamed protein product, partial [Callosobruchus maculatus]